MNDINQENWVKPSKQKPNDLQKIEFIPKNRLALNGKIEKGVFIESEDMFFGSFEDETDNFYFSEYVAFWRPLIE